MKTKEINRRLKKIDPVANSQQFNIDGDQKTDQILQRILSRASENDTGVDAYSDNYTESSKKQKNVLRFGFAPSAAVLILAIIVAGVIFKFSSSYDTDRSATAGGPKDELVTKLKGQLQGIISNPGIWHYKFEVKGLYFGDQTTEEGWLTTNGRRTRVLRYDSQGKLSFEGVISARVVTRYSGVSGKVIKKRVPKDRTGLVYDVNPLKEVAHTLKSGEVTSIRSETVDGQPVYIMLVQPMGFRITYTVARETLYPVQYRYGDEKAYTTMDFKTFEILPETSENRQLLKFKGPAGK